MVIWTAIVVGVAVGHNAMYGPQAAYFSELFGASVRYSGASIAVPVRVGRVGRPRAVHRDGAAGVAREGSGRRLHDGARGDYAGLDVLADETYRNEVSGYGHAADLKVRTTPIGSSALPS